MVDTASNARELLELERRYQKVKLSELESNRWLELVKELFGAKDSRVSRRSFRLPSNARATVRAPSGTFNCAVLEISHLGLTASGENFKNLARGEPLLVESIDLGGTLVTLGFRCSLARTGGSNAGLIATVENSPGIRSRFFSEVYYPTYLRYLENLANRKFS